MSEEQLNASLDAEGAKLLEEGAAADVEPTDEELAGVAGGVAEHGLAGGSPFKKIINDQITDSVTQ